MEVLVVIALILILVMLAWPVAGKLIRRSEDMAALATVRQILAVARLEAIKASANVVVVVGRNEDNIIQLESFRDKADLTTTNPNDGNGTQDAGEPTLGEVTLSPRVHLWKQGGTDNPVDVKDAVLFDTCGGGNASRLWPSRACIVFLPGGGIPPGADPANPLATPSGRRGIYFADWQGKNYFRATVESYLSGKARVDKYFPGSTCTDGPPCYYPPSPATRWSWL